MSVGRAGQERVLRLSEGRDEGVDSLVFALRVGRHELGRFSVPMAELGLGAPASRYASVQRRDAAREMTLPAPRAEEIRALAGRAPEHSDVLWLELEPGGGLDQVPWERWLAPLVGAPILRWPHFMKEPKRDAGRLDVVICADVPDSKPPVLLPELIDRSVREARNAGLDAAFHVFADRRFTPGLRHRDLPGVEVCSAADAQVRSEKKAVDNPWLHWMLDRLPGSVDLVYFICHGFLDDGEGSLAFAESSFDATSRRVCFSGSAELAAFLDRAGAVGFGLASPPDNNSVSALYALADQVARERPGPVLVHDLERGETGDFGRALAFLFGKKASSPPDGVSIYCHPDLVRRRRVTLGTLSLRGGRSYESLEASEDSYVELPYSLSFSVPGTTRDGGTTRGGGAKTLSAEAPETPPQWLPSVMRTLERQAVELGRMGERHSEHGQATRQGKLDALRFVNDLLKRHLEEDR